MRAKLRPTVPEADTVAAPAPYWGAALVALSLASWAAAIAAAKLVMALI